MLYFNGLIHFLASQIPQKLAGKTARFFGILKFVEFSPALVRQFFQPTAVSHVEVE